MNNPRLLFGQIIVSLGMATFGLTAAAMPVVPAFLPAHYSTVLKINDKPLVLVAQHDKAGVKLAEYKNADGSVRLKIEQANCDRSQCGVFYQQAGDEQNKLVTLQKGQFLSLSPVEFSTEWKTGGKTYLQYVAMVPKAVMRWTWSAKSGGLISPYDNILVPLRRSLNEQRYNEALQINNVEVGSWAKEIHQHGRDLLAQGQTEQALGVLRQVVNWSPNLFEAQLDLADSTKDPATIRASAEAVWNNAENPVLLSRAAALLDRKETAISDLPKLEAGITGLQVVLIPLPPCDIRLIEEAAKLYSDSLQLPVKIVRLPDPWQWWKPDRLYQQKNIQNLILQKNKKPIDFNGWTQAQYAQKLVEVSSKEDALTRFRVRTFLETLPGKPPQYRVEPFLEQLINKVMPFYGNDRRTMFVGVTQADIFTGDTNFLFSQGASRNGLGVSILSYARMEATALGQAYESRKQLAERLAKELVPASLKLLDIPRPTDPTDPYSYSSGTDRFQQKTMKLSAPTREALDRFRTPNPQPAPQ